jgi:hypothetical protein
MIALLFLIPGIPFSDKFIFLFMFSLPASDFILDILYLLTQKFYSIHLFLLCVLQYYNDDDICCFDMFCEKYFVLSTGTNRYFALSTGTLPYVPAQY